jgi:hypothetical protein
VFAATTISFSALHIKLQELIESSVLYMRHGATNKETLQTNLQNFFAIHRNEMVGSEFRLAVYTY